MIGNGFGIKRGIGGGGNGGIIEEVDPIYSKDKSNIVFEGDNVNRLQGAVDTSSNQIIGGVKTFSNFPVLPTDSPTQDREAVNKKYVDDRLMGLTWKNPVLDMDLSSPPPNPQVGDRYRVKPPGQGSWQGLDNQLVEWNGSQWVRDGQVQEGWAVLSTDTNTGYTFDGTDWIIFSGGLNYVEGDGIDIEGNVISVKTGGITNNMLAGGITDNKLQTITTTNKVSWSAVNKTGSKLDDLGDVDVSTAQHMNVLTYDATQAKWVAMPVEVNPSGGGGDILIDVSLLSYISSASITLYTSLTEINPPRNRIKINLSNMKKFRIQATCSSGTSYGYLGIQYSIDNGNTWYFLADDSGVYIQANQQGIFVGSWVDIVSEAKTEVILRLVSYNGNGSTRIFSQIHLQFLATGGSGFVGTKEVDETNIADGRILVYDASIDKLEYEDKTDEKVKASSTDLQAGYLNEKIQKSIVLDNTTQKIQLQGDSANPGSNKYYGTDNTGTKGFYNLPGGGNPGGVNSSVQYNDNGNFSGNSSFVYDSSTNSLRLSVKEGNLITQNTTGGTDEAIEWFREAFRIDLGSSEKKYIRIKVRLKNSGYDNIDLSLKVYDDNYGYPGTEITTSLNINTIPNDGQYREYSFDFYKGDNLLTSIWVSIEGFYIGLYIDRTTTGTGEYAYYDDINMNWVLEDNKRVWYKVYDLIEGQIQGEKIIAEGWEKSIAFFKLLQPTNNHKAWITIGQDEQSNNATIGFHGSTDWYKSGLFIIYGRPGLDNNGFLKGFFIDYSGRVKINNWNTQTTSALYVNGDFTATGTKNFDIEHPDENKRQQGYRLRHSAIESNEVLVLYRGKGKIDEKGLFEIKLPDYFNLLVDINSISCHLTKTSRGDIWVKEEKYNENKVIVEGEKDTEFTYLILAVRKGYENYDAEYKPNEELKLQETAGETTDLKKILEIKKRNKL